MSRIAMIVWNEFRNDARVLKEAQTLQASGHQVTVFALHTPGATAQREALPCGAEVVRVSRSPLWKLRKRKPEGVVWPVAATNAQTAHMSLKCQVLRIGARFWTHWALLWRMTAHRADVVHSHDVNTLPTAWLAARLSGARIIYDAHEISTSREGYSNFRNVVGCVERFLMPRVDGTITTTNARAKFFARAYGIKRPLVLQNRPRFSISAPSSRIRDELGLQAAWPIVLYQGGLQQGRGLERLVRVARAVEAYFVFIGDGRLAPRLMRLASELELAERVRFIPTVSLAELPAYTASADIGVQPIENTCFNHYTTDSNKLFEYLIAGLPVVASDLPEIRKIVREHEIGLLVPPGDDQQLVAALNRLVVDTALRKRLSENGLRSARELNWEQQEGSLVELYRKVLGIGTAAA